jgi:hypothetical protein
MSLGSVPGGRRLLIALVLLVAGLAVASFVLPYVGRGGHGLAPLP